LVFIAAAIAADGKINSQAARLARAVGTGVISLGASINGSPADDSIAGLELGRQALVPTIRKRPPLARRRPFPRCAHIFRVPHGCARYLGYSLSKYS
jgi:DNA-binding transcriptional LysR family regulator